MILKRFPSLMNSLYCFPRLHHLKGLQRLSHMGVPLSSHYQRSLSLHPIATISGEVSRNSHLLGLVGETFKNVSLKGSFTIFLFLVRSHILNSNGMWYSWFCPEGPINASNSKFLVFYFAPRDLDSQRHMGPWLAAQGTLTRSAGDLDSQRHRFPMALRVKVPCAAS